MKREKEVDVFYVGVPDCVNLRRELLYSSKTLIDGLKRYERYSLLEEEKLACVAELKRVFDEILVLNRKFRGLMPKAPIQDHLEKPVPKEPVRKEVVREMPKSHMGVLEDELSKIEQRLKALK